LISGLPSSTTYYCLRHSTIRVALSRAIGEQDFPVGPCLKDLSTQDAISFVACKLFQTSDTAVSFFVLTRDTLTKMAGLTSLAERNNKKDHLSYSRY
jgi:hypothetical protein